MIVIVVLQPHRIVLRDPAQPFMLLDCLVHKRRMVLLGSCVRSSPVDFDDVEVRVRFVDVELPDGAI